MRRSSFKIYLLPCFCLLATFISPSNWCHGQKPILDELDLRETFFEFSRIAVDGQNGNEESVRRLGNEFLQSHDQWRQQDPTTDPTRYCHLNYLAVAASCSLGDFPTARKLAEANRAWCEKNIANKNSYHLQTAKAYSYYLNQLTAASELERKQFAETLMTKWHHLIALRFGHVQSDVEILNAVNGLKLASDSFAKILGPANWFSFESDFYHWRNSAVSEAWKQGIEELIAMVPDLKFIMRNHLIVSDARITLANYDSRRGKTGSARQYLAAVQQVDKQYETTELNRGLVASVSADIERIQGRPKDALLISRKAVAQFSQIPLDQLTVRQCVHRARTIDKLASFQSGLGDIQNAIPNLEKSIDMWFHVSRYSPSRVTSLRLGESLLNLAKLQLRTRQKTRAAIRASQALKQLRVHFPIDSIFYRHNSLVAATVFAQTGEMELAAQLVSDALDDFEPESETLSPQAMVHFLQQANFVLMQNGDFETAKSLIDATMSRVNRTQLPEKTKEGLVQSINQNAAAVALRSGEREMSFELTDQAIQKRLEQIPSELMHFDEAETLVSAGQLHSLTLMLLAGTDPSNPENVKQAWNAVTQTKALGSQLLAFRDQKISEFDKELGERYRKIRAELSSLAFRMRYEDSPELNARFRSLENEKKTLFSELPNEFKSIVFGSTQDQAKLDTLVNQLDERTVLVDLVRNSRLRIGGKLQYQAFVGYKDSNGKFVAKFLRLGDANQIDQWVNDWRSQFVVSDPRDIERKHKPPEVDFRSAGVSIFREVWNPIAAEFSGRTKVIISGDGAMARLPWSTIPNGETFKLTNGKQVPGCLLDDFEIIDTISFRLLAKRLGKPERNDSGSSDKTATAFLDVEYGTATKPTQNNVPAWPKLGASTKELIAFKQCFGESNCQAFTNSSATKQRFQTAAPATEFLHISTHGYHLPPYDTIFVDQLYQSLSIYRRNPWVSCGIVFANANTNRNDSDSALFSGEETVCFGFENLKLVVLGACKSGTGEIFEGEGSFGMQHAFLLAGARTAVGSYWAVSDSKTELFMEKFYGLLATDLSVGDALHETRKSLRREGLHAKHWGAWMLSGDWNTTR